MFRDLSFRYRVPLNVSLVVLVTGLCIAGVLVWHDYRAFRQDAGHSAEHLGRILSHALAPELAVEDTWQAYRTLTALFEEPGESWLRPEHAVVIDSAGVTLVSSDPSRFPLATPADALGDDLATILEHAAGLSGEGINFPASGVTYRIEPVFSGDVHLGTLVLAFSDSRLLPRYHQGARQVLLATGLIMLVLLPLGWTVGRRLAGPLMEIEACVARWVERKGREPTECPVEPQGNELGRLVNRIQAVSEELAEKDRLERQIVRSERQAALGRLAAGVAHEINNPLGGMFTAIATYKRHGQDPRVAEKTVTLLERGLDQIRHIVSALLVEVKAEPRDLDHRDLRDLAELLAPRAREKRLQLTWPEAWEGALPLPAGPVRQVVMNLVLNAVQAAPEGGAVDMEFTIYPSHMDFRLPSTPPAPRSVVAAPPNRAGYYSSRRLAPGHGERTRKTENPCATGIQQRTLTIRVANEGEPIPEERLENLFEPFVESGWGGSGLGLWITDQTVRQLHGRIQVFFETGRTVFQVELPLEEEK